MKLSSAGAASDGVKVCVESRTEASVGALSLAEQDRPRNAHGTSGERRHDERALRGQLSFELHRQLVHARARGRNVQRRASSASGVTSNSTAAAPSRATRMSSERFTRRNRDVAHGRSRPRHASVRSARGRTRATSGGAASSRRRCAADVDQPRTLRGRRIVRQGTRRSDEQALERVRVEVRTRLREQRCAACDERGGDARPVDGSVARGPVGVRAGLRHVSRATPGATTSGLTRPSKASPDEEKLSDAALAAVGRRAHRAKRDGCRRAAPELRQNAFGNVFGNRDGGDRRALVEPDSSGGEIGAVEEDRDGARARGVRDSRRRDRRPRGRAPRGRRRG